MPYRDVSVPPRPHGAIDLEPGERILWSGRPRRAPLLRTALSALVLPLLWNGLVVAILCMTATCVGPLWLCAAPLLAIGALLFQPGVDAFHRARATTYFVTDRRAIVREGDDVLSYDAPALRAVVAVESARGEGDLVFLTRQRVDACERPAGFAALEQVREVETLVREHVLQR